VNKLTENGSFRSSRTSFCSLVPMVPTDLILEPMDRLERSIDGDTETAPRSVLDALDRFANEAPPNASSHHDRSERSAFSSSNEQLTP
jgi:hypothetical protein